MPNQHNGRRERKYIRYRCDQRLCIRYRKDNQDFIAYGRCNMVGKGGIGALLPTANLEIGQVVSLEIALSTPAAPSVLKAQVKNRHGLNYSFQFLETNGRAAALLQDLFRPEAVAAFSVS